MTREPQEEKMQPSWKSRPVLFTSSATFLGSFAGPLLGGVGSAFLGIRWMLGVAGALYICNMLWVLFKVQEPRSLVVR